MVAVGNSGQGNGQGVMKAVDYRPEGLSPSLMVMRLMQD